MLRKTTPLIILFFSTHNKNIKDNNRILLFHPRLVWILASGPDQVHPSVHPKCASSVHCPLQGDVQLVLLAGKSSRGSGSSNRM